MKAHTPLESPAINGGDGKDKILFPYRKGGVKAPSFLTGFTMIEILVVIFIMALLVATAMPNFLKAQREVQKITCISNLKQIDEATERYAASFQKSPGDDVTWSCIIPLFLKLRPRCPSQGTYYISQIGVKPTCSLESLLDHKLP